MGDSQGIIKEIREYAKSVKNKTYFSKSPEDLLEVSNEVVRGRYANEGESEFYEVASRVTTSVLTFEDNPEQLNSVLKYLCEEKNPKHQLCLALDKFTSKEKPYYYRFIQFLTRVFMEMAALPGGRILTGAGVDRNVTLTNCYVLPSPEDSIEGIFETAYQMARTFSYGGGVGIDISSLRPEGSPVHNAARESSGAWSFTLLYDAVVNVIGQHGRRGALLISMDVSHPDIFSFVTSKSKLSPLNQERLKLFKSILPEESWDYVEKTLVWTQLMGMNISVMLTGEFMDAVRNDKDWELKFGDKIVRTVPARELWNFITESAWSSADPGLLFKSSAKKYSTTEYFAPIVTTNPCGEQWLDAGGSCNLASVNFASEFYQRWKQAVVSAMVVFMDMVINYNMNRHPLEVQRKANREARRIGLGFMGLAEVMARNKIAWDEREKVERFINREVGKLVIESYRTSAILGEVLGAFPKFDPDKHFDQPFFQRLREHSQAFNKLLGEIKVLRNSALNTVAPTGTTSVVAGTSSGIEPFFFPKVSRFAPSLGKVLEYKYKEFHKWDKENPGKPYPKYLRTAHEINPEDRVFVQGLAQKWIDNSISSTVNLPNSATVEDVRKIYELAYEYELKGITVYRDGSKFSIISDSDKKKQSKAKSDKKMIAIPDTDLFDRPMSMKCIRYRIPTPEGKMNIVICGDDNNPLEIYLGSREAECYTHKIAVNMMFSSALTMLYKLDKELYDTYLNHILYKLRQFKDKAFSVWGDRVDSIFGAIALAMDLFIKGKTPEDYLKSKFGLTLTIPLPDKIEYEETNKPNEDEVKETLSITFTPVKDGKPDKGFVNLYGKDVDITNLPTDAYASKCPQCGTLHITKDAPYPFDCNNPCQICGYAGKCSGD